MSRNDHWFALGVDIGGTKVRVGLVDELGRILSAYKHPTHANKGPMAAVDDLVTCIEECLQKSKLEVTAIGVGVAGLVDSKGIIRDAPNLDWRNFRLKENLQSRLGRPVAIVNDVQAAVLGEWLYGSGRQVNNLVLLCVGTGIGGGIISNGQVVIGCSNSAGELGHITIVAGGRECHCRNLGCLEAYAGGWAIAERAQEAVRLEPKAGTHLLKLVGGEINRITAETVSQAAKKRDSLAIRVVEETGNFLAAGAVGIVNVFNPRLLILGGSVIEGLPSLIEKVKKTIQERALGLSSANVEVVKSALGNYAGVIGAAAYAKAGFGKLIA